MRTYPLSRRFANDPLVAASVPALSATELMCQRTDDHRWISGFQPVSVDPTFTLAPTAATTDEGPRIDITETTDGRVFQESDFFRLVYNDRRIRCAR